MSWVMNIPFSVYLYLFDICHNKKLSEKEHVLIR